jgi:peptidoglycan/LPS O-acetylase OafA/YrhL
MAYAVPTIALPGKLTISPPCSITTATVEMPPVATPKPYLAGLDALRAVAALSVCLYHCTGGMLPKLMVPAAKQAFSYGYLGVDIFFVISGFIIPYSLLGKNYRVTGIFTYLKKRIVRITPPAYVSLLLIIGQWYFIDKFINHDAQYTGALSLGQVVHNVLFTVPFTHYGWISTLFWTLAIEFQFYLFIGLLFNHLFGRSLAWFIGIYALVAMESLLPAAQAAGFLHYSPLFALGGLALLWQQQRLSWLAYAGALLLFGGLAYWQLGLYAALLSTGTALAINSITFRIPGLSALGKISFSLYLVHGILATTAEFVLVKLLPPTTDARKLALTAACLLAAIGGSFLFHTFIEKPFLRLASPPRRQA